MLDELKLRYSITCIMVQSRQEFIKNLPPDDTLPWSDALEEYKAKLEYYGRKIKRLQKVMKVDEPISQSWAYKLRNAKYNPVC